MGSQLDEFKYPQLAFGESSMLPKVNVSSLRARFHGTVNVVRRPPNWLYL